MIMNTKMMKKVFGVLLSLIMLVGLVPVTAYAADNPHADHSGYISHVEAVAANCTTPGNIEFWYCDYYACQKCYSDEAMTQEIAPGDVIITPPAHSDACVGCGHTQVQTTFEPFVPEDQPDYDEEYYFWSNGGFHGAFSERLYGRKFIFVAADDAGTFYAMSNDTNEDGSRNAVNLSAYWNDDYSVTVDSDTVEFFTYKSIPNSYTFSADNGYMSVMDGKIVVRGQNIEDFRKQDLSDPNDDLYPGFPQAIRFEQDNTLSDYGVDMGAGYLFAWNLNSGLILFDRAELKFKPVLMSDETSYDNRVHNVLLYVERCNHSNLQHTEGVEPSCTEDGNIEYWYCGDCRLYYRDAEAMEPVELPEEGGSVKDSLVIPSYGHDFDDNGDCQNCGLGNFGEEICLHPNAYLIYEGSDEEPTCFEPVPGSVLFCEDCWKYLDESKENAYWDENEARNAVVKRATGHAFNEDTGTCDYCGISNPVYSKVTSLADVNENDLYIFVAEADGKHFVLGGLCQDEEDIEGNLQCGADLGNAIAVTPNEDGSISLLNQRTAVGAEPSEFMLDINPEQFACGLEEFGLTTVIPKLPNHCVYPFQSRSFEYNGYMGVPRYGNGEYGMWDSSDWIIDFYTTYADENTYRDDMDGFTHAEQVERGNIDENIGEGNLLMYRSSYVSVGGAMFTLRLREYNGQYYFICGEDWMLDGAGEWEPATDTTPTNDTQYAIWLYRSNVTEEEHTCSFTAWEPNEDGQTHIRFCRCGKSETESHSWGEGVVTVPATHYEEGEMTYTCTVCEAAKTEAVPKLPDHTWSDWANAGDHHIRECKCGEVETAAHSWGEGVVTVPATHYEEGEMSFTCTVCEGTITASVPKLPDHEWSDWANAGDHHIRECKCGETERKVHNWGEWALDHDGSYKRSCDTCDAVETLLFDPNKPVDMTPPTNAYGTVLDMPTINLVDSVLTDEEQTQLAGGSTVSIYLVAEDITETVTTTEKNAAAAAAGSNEIGMYLDIDLFKQVDSEETQVTETNGMITVTITVPDELLSDDAETERVYKIIRVHEDAYGTITTDVIEGKFNPENNTFTFETDKFSTYVLIYSKKDIATAVLLGDINGSGGVDSKDLVRLRKYLADPDNTEIRFENADVNNDGSISSKDLVRMRKHLADGAVLG